MFRSAFDSVLTDTSDSDEDYTVEEYDTTEAAATAMPNLRSASGNHYEWHLFDGQKWSQICNDHIIEANYCQVGVRGMTIHTDLGSLYIDFDAMTVRGPFTGLRIRRQTFLSQGQTQDIAWYYKDDTCWCEYGSQGASHGTSTTNSQDLEKRYNSNPRSSFQFTIGSNTYTLDFTAMTQTNMYTHMVRKVRRRPKFNSIVSVNNSSQMNFAQLSLSTLSMSPPTGVIWEFMGDEGVWTEYQKPGCSLNSADIERQYQLNPQRQLNFTVGRYSYTLSFSEMYQTNDRFGTMRHIRRTVGGNLYISSSQSQARWQFRDMDGSWKDYVKGSRRGNCTVSSQEIEAQYQRNKTGIMSFSTGKFNYQLNFTGTITLSIVLFFTLSDVEYKLWFTFRYAYIQSCLPCT
uniref:WWE domain-containing protein n=2 Tax=Astyanax mexicanus TaxID=7994 RepID=A0A3B1J1U6_ASTMX